jgi:ribosomal protein L37AE/L43A
LASIDRLPDEKLAEEQCSVCSAKKRMRRRGKIVVCCACGSEFVELRGQLVLSGKMNRETRSEGSGRRWLRQGSAA